MTNSQVEGQLEIFIKQWLPFWFSTLWIIIFCLDMCQEFHLFVLLNPKNVVDLELWDSGRSQEVRAKRITMIRIVAVDVSDQAPQDYFRVYTGATPMCDTEHAQRSCFGVVLRLVY